jgi:uncharacterized repeat protein (TIGR01451 family)
VAPGGTATNNDYGAQYLDADNTSTTIIPFATSWKYLGNAIRPTSWETTTFNDGAWSTGTLASATADFGYGDNDEGVCVPYGCNSNICYPTNACVKAITTLFRKQFTVTGLVNYSGFQLNLHRDDGAVIYINGTEVARSNMPAGAMSNAILATASVDGADEDVIINIGKTNFVEGTNTIAVEIHQNVNTSTDISFRLQMTALYQPFVNYGGAWKYLANNTRPVGWETSAFNDIAWPSGNSELGYGDGGEATVVPYGPTATNKYITTYFRKTFTIADVSLYSRFILNLIRDDGAVVYINGVEVIRNNMPAGAINHSTLASTVVSGAGETTPVNFSIPASYFVTGTNTIAVEMHQENVNSSDISFNLELQGSPDPTFSSSSSNLNLASCSRVLWAGLYWGATQGSDGANTSWLNGESSVKVKIPGSTVYQTITSSQTDYHNNTLVPGLPHSGYRAFADITSLINATNPNGTYWVADVVGPIGINNGSGGWTIVVAYANPTQIPRNLTVFDGSAIMNGGDPALFVPITGFLTPPSGPVTTELGAVVYDGDRANQDEFSFKQNSNPLVGTYTNLTPNATSNINDMWNSTITYKGAEVTTRFPAHSNTLGYDADIIEVANPSNAVLGNNQTSASIRFSSPSENYFIHVVSTAISVYSPSFALEKGSTDLNGGGVAPGDVIRYHINYQNVGNDASANTAILDNLPVATSFVPGSIRINGIAKTDMAGDDEAEYDFVNRRVVLRLGTGANAVTGGVVGTTVTGSVTFDVYAASSCQVLSCGTPTNNIARIDYIGQTSSIPLYDSSGYLLAGCLTQGPITNVISGSCFVPTDTILVNSCPSTSVMLPIARFAGYNFYSAMPFIPANIYNANNPVTLTHTYYAYFNSGVGCSDTIQMNVFIMACPDIDDDNDGIPDYLEINIPAAVQDLDLDGVPNWNDTDYTGYTDNNADGFNDNFDPTADSDNDGIVNFLDHNFPGFVDANSDGVNDTMDKDMDGIPNNFDLDSDNDGIPDVVESFGVDANGDGRIDGYTDTDNDGLSQNVDGGSSGVSGSGVGLGALDIDNDGIPNYLDIDSDNDGIPDVIEANGTDTNNDGRIDGYVDTDGDGYSDNIDGDVANDGSAENAAAALLRTGADNNGDGRCDTFPYNNMDSDARPNPYDLDSDSDGIADVREAVFIDLNYDALIDGPVNSQGWNAAVASSLSLSLPNADGVGRPNVYDIDSDDDGIPDNVEGQPTASYHLATGADSDNDGIDNRYDNISGFGGDGLHPIDTDGDGSFDYTDTDTDSDGIIDLIEGNDLDLNGEMDDAIAVLGVDTDGDGLDDFFDNNNNSTEGTSQYMGELGTTAGDATPGSITTVQRSAQGCTIERDWRCLSYVLTCNLLLFKGSLQDQTTLLNWEILCEQEMDKFIVERSINMRDFKSVAIVPAVKGVSIAQLYSSTDDISALNSEIIYYRLRMASEKDRSSLSNIIVLRRNKQHSADVQIAPNPVRETLQIFVTTAKPCKAAIYIIDAKGRVVQEFSENLFAGNNTIVYNHAADLAAGVYYLRLNMGGQTINKKFSIIK